MILWFSLQFYMVFRIFLFEITLSVFTSPRIPRGPIGPGAPGFPGTPIGPGGPALP